MLRWLAGWHRLARAAGNALTASAATAWAGKIVLYGAWAAFIGVFSGWPAYQHLAAERALIKLSIVHHGERLEECRKRTPAELAELPPNMRAPMECPRARAPISVEVNVDGVQTLREIAAPTGLAHDGPAALYWRLEVPAGRHEIAVRIADTARQRGFDFERIEAVVLRPAQILVIDFEPAQGGITLR